MTLRDLSGIQHKAGYQSDDDPMDFVMSTESEDRSGDVIVQSGWNLKDFRKNPIALFAHDHQKVVGTWSNVRVEGKRLIGRLNLAARGTSQIVDEVRNLIEQRILKAVSVGFSAQDYEMIEVGGRWEGGIKFLKTTLHECSVVAVPANQEALALAKDLKISKETRDLVFRAVKGAKSSRDSDILGTPSHILRARRQYERDHPHAEY